MVNNMHNLYIIKKLYFCILKNLFYAKNKQKQNFPVHKISQRCIMMTVFLVMGITAQCHTHHSWQHKTQQFHNQPNNKIAVKSLSFQQR